jgi:ABC-type sugar transport system, periplasmic component
MHSKHSIISPMFEKPIKIITNVLIVIFAFYIFMIWYRGSSEPSVQTSASLIQYYKIYLITVDKTPYWHIVDQGASDMAKAIGVNYIWDAPDVRSVERQIEIIKKAVNDGANALLVAADDPKKIAGVIEDAKARGVKIVYVDSPAYEEAITTLSSDNYQAGATAGRTMLSELQKQNITSGSIGIVSVESKENTQEREAGFRKIITDDSKFTLLDTVYTDGSVEASKEAADGLMKENSGIVGIIGINQGTGEGVGKAIEEGNYQITGIGFDDTEMMLKLLNDGSLKALIVQNEYTMGYLGMAQAVAAVLGKDTGPSYLNTGTSVME